MSLVVYAEASAESNPGHMVVGEEPIAGPSSYFGYRFDPADLPEEYRRPEQWRSYLFENAVVGMIVDETAYVRHLLGLGESERVFYEKRAECDLPIQSRIPDRRDWVPHGWYSFNPDDPHVGRQPCFNCVKWAITIANSPVEGFWRRCIKVA